MRVEPPKEKTYLEDEISLISLSSITDALIGLNEQALGFRKEALGKDYLHKFYEDHLT